MTITTERLILRPFKESDAEVVFEYLKEPTVHCFYDMKFADTEAQRYTIKPGVNVIWAVLKQAYSPTYNKQREDNYDQKNYSHR